MDYRFCIFEMFCHVYLELVPRLHQCGCKHTHTHTGAAIYVINWLHLPISEATKCASRFSKNRLIASEEKVKGKDSKYFLTFLKKGRF